MRITKSMAEDVAVKMTSPITSKIEGLQTQLKDIAFEAIMRTIPHEVLDCYQKHQSYFMTPRHVYLCHERWQMLIAELPSFPGTAGIYPHIQVGAEAMERLNKIEITIKETKEEKERTAQSIIATLASLRTVKNVKENFAEAYEHLEKFERKGCTVIALPIKNILFSINKYALTPI